MAGAFRVCVVDGIEDGLPFLAGHCWPALQPVGGSCQGGLPAQVCRLGVHCITEVVLQ